MSNPRWFLVKTLYRTMAKGRPKNRDRFYKPGIAVVEERLVLFTARNPASALKKAETEARKYCKSLSTTNVYGQKVVTEFIDFIESYEMFDPPGNGVEIFSFLESVPAGKSIRSLIASRDRQPLDPSLSPQFIAAFISEELQNVFGTEWPSKKTTHRTA